MSELDIIYIHLLRVGIVVLKQAIDAGNSEWARAEVEMLHNIPSLVGEENPERHRYYWNEERPYYIAWAESHGTDETRSRIRTYYEPIWNELEKLHAAGWLGRSRALPDRGDADRPSGASRWGHQ